MSATDTPASLPAPAAPDSARRSPWGEVLHSLSRSGTFLTGLF
ncbi:ABC transporter permease, partial [Mesorhizobium sp. M00.F.Ca.ET.149.01.1.1]